MGTSRPSSLGAMLSSVALSRGNVMSTDRGKIARISALVRTTRGDSARGSICEDVPGDVVDDSESIFSYYG